MSDLTIDYEKWRAPKPAGLSACIRLRNEGQFMYPCIKSILPLVDEAVLVVQPSDDDTEAVAERLAHEDRKVKVFKYDLVPDWINTPGFYSKDPNQPGHLVHMSNWALSKCSFDQILKVEGDVLALSRLHWMVEEAWKDKTHYYGIVILNIAGENFDKISLENPRNGGWDEAFIPNNPDLCWFERRDKWEVLTHNLPASCLGWGLLHLKRCKKGKETGWNGEHYIPWTRQNVARALSEYNRNAYPGPDHPLGQNEWLYEATSLFGGKDD